MLNTKKILRNGLLIIAVVAISVITIMDLRGAVRYICAGLFMLAYVCQTVENKTASLFFITTFTADLQVSIAGIPFITLLQLIYIVQIIFGIKNKLIVKSVIGIGIICMLQIPSVIFYQQTFLHIVVFAVNMLVMVSIVYESINRNGKFSDNCLLFFTVGLTVTLIAGILRDSRNVSWERYTGLWTDPNFLGLFCLIGISILVSKSQLKAKNLLMYMPLMVLFIYSGYMTLSRTFIIVFVLFIVYTIIKVLTSNSIKFGAKLLTLVVVVICLILFYENVWTSIVNQRGITAGEGDITHGRVEATKTLLDYWINQIPALLFGIGVDNSIGLGFEQTHNSYADTLIFFGIFGVMSIIGFIGILYKNAHIRIKDLYNDKALYIAIFVVYAGTLSLYNTDALYLFFGLLPGIIKNAKANKCIE